MLRYVQVVPTCRRLEKSEINLFLTSVLAFHYMDYDRVYSILLVLSINSLIYLIFVLHDLKLLVRCYQI